MSQVKSILEQRHDDLSSSREMQLALDYADALRWHINNQLSPEYELYNQIIGGLISPKVPLGSSSQWVFGPSQQPGLAGIRKDGLERLLDLHNLLKGKLLLKDSPLQDTLDALRQSANVMTNRDPNADRDERRLKQESPNLPNNSSPQR